MSVFIPAIFLPHVLQITGSRRPTDDDLVYVAVLLPTPPSHLIAPQNFSNSHITAASETPHALGSSTLGTRQLHVLPTHTFLIPLGANPGKILIGP